MRRWDTLLVALAFGTVVGCFVSSSTVAERSMGAITGRSREISSHSLPCVIHLSAMRGQMRAIERALDAAPAGELGPGSRWLPNLLEALEQTEGRYSRLVRTDGDEAQWVDIRGSIDDVRTIASVLWTRVAAGETGAALHADLSNLKALIVSADRSLGEMIGLTERDGQRAAVEVDAARVRASRMVYGLDAVSVLVTLALAIAVLSMQRRHRAETDRQLDELRVFSARVAHDVRGPLTPALLALQRLHERLAPGDPMCKLVERGLRSLRTVSGTVDGLLAFALAGAPSKAAENASLKETVEAVVNEYADAAERAGIDLRIEEVDMPCAVHCAAGVLASILGNLVANAIKYMNDSRDRRVSIRSSRRGRMVHVEVCDTGPGVPSGAEKRIFEAYVRGQEGGPGLGLGLATVKRLVLSHGGAVGVRERYEGGAIFWFELPVAPSLDAPVSAARRALSP